MLLPVNTLPYTGAGRTGQHAHSDSDGVATGASAHADSMASATDLAHADSSATAQNTGSHADSHGLTLGSGAHANTQGTADGDFAFASRGGQASGAYSAAMGMGAVEQNTDFECLGGASQGLAQFHRCALASFVQPTDSDAAPLGSFFGSGFTPTDRATSLVARIRILADDDHGNLLLSETQILASKSGSTWSILSQTALISPISIGTTTGFACTATFDIGVLLLTPAIPSGNAVTYVAIMDVLEKLAP